MASAGDRCSAADFSGKVTPKCANYDGICDLLGALCTVKKSCMCGGAAKSESDSCIVSADANYNVPCGASADMCGAGLACSTTGFCAVGDGAQCNGARGADTASSLTCRNGMTCKNAISGAMTCQLTAAKLIGEECNTIVETCDPALTCDPARGDVANKAAMMGKCSYAADAECTLS